MPVASALLFHSTELRLIAITELIRSHAEHTHLQIALCARHYKERALKELFPKREWLSNLPSDQKQAVYRRAIQMAKEDAAEQGARQ